MSVIREEDEAEEGGALDIDDLLENMPGATGATIE